MTTNVASAVRPGLRDNRATSSPHTPTRFTNIGSNFSSPGSPYKPHEEDAVIIELGSRYLRAGFEGESGPQCVLPFTRESSRRVGDYRAHAPGYQPPTTNFNDWARENELWRNDLKEVDLGLVEDKLERLTREVYNKYLLANAGTARLVLVLPSIIPHPLLERILTLLFDRWSYPTITLLPSPTMCAAAAGLRSGLVVDIGWEETIATPLYEYRELRSSRTSRAMKIVVEEASAALTEFASQQLGLKEATQLDQDFVEEVVIRISHSELQTSASSSEDILSTRTKDLSLDEPTDSQQTSRETNRTIELDWPIGTSFKQVNLPAAIVPNLITSVFVDPGSERSPLDDHEQTVPELIYRALLALSPDVRGICMSRIVFVGGGSHIPGLSTRILHEVQKLIDRHGWTSVRGKKVTEQRQKLGELNQGRTEPPSARHNILIPPEEKNTIEIKVQKQWAKNANPQNQVTGVLREVQSLGAWAGASLLTSLKIKGFVEIGRERFMSHGLAGAYRDTDVSVVPQQRMSSFGLGGVRNNAQAAWTLGGWG